MRLGRYLVAFALILTASAITIPSQAMGQGSGANTFMLARNTIVSCWYWAVEFNATGGEQFQMQWSSYSQLPTTLDFYITSPSATRSLWYCDYGPESLYTNAGAFASSGWVAPASEEYVALIVNNHPYPVSGSLSMMAANATVSVVVQGYAMARQEPYCPPCLGQRN